MRQLQAYTSSLLSNVKKKCSKQLQFSQWLRIAEFSCYQMDVEGGASPGELQEMYDCIKVEADKNEVQLDISELKNYIRHIMQQIQAYYLGSDS